MLIHIKFEIVLSSVTVMLSCHAADGGATRSFYMRDFEYRGGLATAMHNSRVWIKRPPTPASITRSFAVGPLSQAFTAKLDENPRKAMKEASAFPAWWHTFAAHRRSRGRRRPDGLPALCLAYRQAVQNDPAAIESQ